MRGVVARRRVAFFGRSYDAGPGRERPIPEFLSPLRERFAAWANVDPRAFAMALINEYGPGAPIGWHRDAPQYHIVAGLSLLSPAWMKFRPYVAPKDIRVRAGDRLGSSAETQDHSRDRAAAAIGVPDVGPLAAGLRAQHPAGEKAPLLDHASAPLR